MYINRRQILFGIGPMGALISFAWLAIAAWTDGVMGHPAISTNPVPVKLIGVIIAVIGLGLLLWSMLTLRNWWAKDKLCTTGPFKWFRHPMYAAWITYILPAAALYLNSWMILFFVILLQPIWHLLVIREEKMMYEKFDDAYRTYAAQTGRFFPRLWNH